MQTPRFLLAWLLLLCLGRTLLPEAWVLALHRHEHTTEEPARAPAFRHKGKALISAGHQHCPVEQFYDVAYQAAGPVPMPSLRVALRYAAAPALPPVRPAAGEGLFARALRGPPARVWHPAHSFFSWYYPASPAAALLRGWRAGLFWLCLCLFLFPAFPC